MNRMILFVIPVERGFAAVAVRRAVCPFPDSGDPWITDFLEVAMTYPVVAFFSGRPHIGACRTSAESFLNFLSRRDFSTLSDRRLLNLSHSQVAGFLVNFFFLNTGHFAVCC